jgi:hypothetical protein
VETLLKLHFLPISSGKLSSLRSEYLTPWDST